jgi:hypothetical protein
MVDRGRLADLKELNPGQNRLDAPSESVSLLNSSFTPGNWDVICQGGKESFDHGELSQLTIS